jgi:hypothetical protein
MSEKGIKKIISFAIAKKMKHLGIYLTKEVKYVYTENYETLKKAQINENVFHVHDLEQLILLKCPKYSKVIYKFNMIPMKNSQE